MRISFFYSSLYLSVYLKNILHYVEFENKEINIQFPITVKTSSHQYISSVIPLFASIFRLIVIIKVGYQVQIKPVTKNQFVIQLWVWAMNSVLTDKWLIREHEFIFFEFILFQNYDLSFLKTNNDLIRVNCSSHCKNTFATILWLRHID